MNDLCDAIRLLLAARKTRMRLALAKGRDWSQLETDDGPRATNHQVTDPERPAMHRFRQLEPDGTTPPSPAPPTQWTTRPAPPDPRNGAGHTYWDGPRDALGGLLSVAAPPKELREWANLNRPHDGLFGIVWRQGLGWGVSSNKIEDDPHIKFVVTPDGPVPKSLWEYAQRTGNFDGAKLFAQSAAKGFLDNDKNYDEDEDEDEWPDNDGNYYEDEEEGL